MIRTTLADSIVQTALVTRILIVDDDDQMRSRSEKCSTAQDTM